VLPEDVATLAHDVLRHRLVLTYEALAEGIDADAILDQVVDAVSAPEVSLSKTEEAA
jgi:MoxR-like ATPase